MIKVSSKKICGENNSCAIEFSFTFTSQSKTLRYQTQFYSTQKEFNCYREEYISAYDSNSFKEYKQAITQVIQSFVDAGETIHFLGETVKLIEQILTSAVDNEVLIQKHENGVLIKRELFLSLMNILYNI